MKQYMIMALFVLVLTGSAFTQTATEPPRMAVETSYYLPKRGMEDKFEAAVLAHDKKYHPDGPYVANLRKIEYGPKSGWYVWVFGPVPYGSLDTRPTKENGHADDWTNNIDPLIEKEGPTYLFNFNTDLSYGLDLVRKAKHYEIWQVDLKPGQFYRFRDLASKLKKAYESMGTTGFLVLDNALHQADGPDVAIVWSFNTYADWAKDDGVKAVYEKQNGAGSWDNMVKDWMDMIISYNAEIRTPVN